MAKIMPSWLLAKRGLIDYNRWVKHMFISCMPLLKDAAPELFEEVIAYTMETQLWPKRRLDMIERISAHVQAGDEVFIATGMWQPTVARFAAQLGAKGLGTDIKFENGRMLLSEPVAHGDDKVEKIKTRLGRGAHRLSLTAIPLRISPCWKWPTIPWRFIPTTNSKPWHRNAVGRSLAIGRRIERFAPSIANIKINFLEKKT